MMRVLSVVFISLFWLQVASADVFRELEKRQLSVLEGSKSVENLKEYISKQKPKFFKNKYKKELLEKEKKLFETFQKLYRGNKGATKKFAQKKYDEFLSIAKSDFSISDFEGLQSEARYLKLLLDKYEMNDEKWKMFDFVLTFMADRLSFSYDQALEYDKKLSEGALKKDFHAFLKRFIELEYQTGKKAEIPQDYRIFMK